MARQRKYRGPISPGPIGPTQGSLGTAMGSRGSLRPRSLWGSNPGIPWHPPKDPRGRRKLVKPSGPQPGPDPRLPGPGAGCRLPGRPFFDFFFRKNSKNCSTDPRDQNKIPKKNYKKFEKYRKILSAGFRPFFSENPDSSKPT